MNTSLIQGLREVERLNAHLLTLMSIPEQGAMCNVSWQPMLTPRGFDQTAKTIYARSPLSDLGCAWATDDSPESP